LLKTHSSKESEEKRKEASKLCLKMDSLIHDPLFFLKENALFPHLLHRFIKKLIPPKKIITTI